MHSKVLHLLTNTFFTLGVLALLYGFNAVRAEQQIEEPRETAGFTQAITYQGQLSDGGVLANGQYDIAASLFDSAGGGSLIGSMATVNNVTVEDGLFSAEFPFGSAEFKGGDRWLEIAFRSSGSTVFTTLSPRQAIRPAPAAHSVPWEGISDLPPSFADGTDDTLAAPLRPGFTNHILDSNGITGVQPSIIIGLDGLPVISYHDDTNNQLMVFHCDDLTCENGTSNVVDSTDNVGRYSSITIGRSGFPLISYYNASRGDLQLARCLDIACTTSTVTTLDTAGDVGLWTSITTTDSGYAFISYYDAGNRDLLALRCNNESCSSNAVWTVDSADKVGEYTSVTRDTSGNAWISYFDETNGDLKVARCFNSSCTSPSLSTVDGDPSSASAGSEEVVGLWTSITTGADGFPLIAYARFDGVASSAARIAHCGNSSCSTATTHTVTSGSGTSIEFRNFSISLGPDGYARAVFSLTGINRAYFIQCLNTECSNTHINDQLIVAPVADTALTIGADGYPIIAYYNDSSDDLRVVHCSDLSCLPYHRRR